MEKKRIIIIDDHPLLRDAWSIILQEKYFVTDKIGKGEDLNDLVRERKPDIVLLDISTARLKEYTLIKLIRKLSPRTRVIAVSLHLGKNSALKLLRLGAKGFIGRSCPAKEFLTAIDTVLKGETYVCKEIKEKEGFESAFRKEPEIERLTEREMQIIQFLKEGFTSKEIAEKISITAKTVQAHRQKIMKKLHVKNSNALIHLVNAHGF